MKFRTKIKISFSLLISIPIMLMIVAMFAIFNMQVKDVEDSYGIKGVGLEGLANQTKIYSKLTENEYDTIISDIKETPEKLADVKYISKLNDSLNKKDSFIIAKQDGVVIFNGCEDSEADMVDKLPNYRGSYEYPKTPEGNSYIYGDYKYLVKQINFKVKGDDESVYIVTLMQPVLPQIKIMIIEIVVSFILITIFTTVVLLFWLQRSIGKPLEKMAEATTRIAQGDLDFKIQTDKKDEFGDLCNDFENMRIRLKESAEERIKFDEENREILSNISHDLKTPLTSIKGYIEGIRDGVANTPSKMDKYIKTIYNKTNDMEKLIAELSLYTKIDNNTATYDFKKVKVGEYFSDCVEEISVELESKNIMLTYFNYTDKDCMVIADPERLKRVINNIISNSVKYIGHKKGAVNIRITDENDKIHVEIEDNGKGIAKEELPYIFDRFYRTDSSRNSDQGGSGIGLAIAKKIIEMHGGKIWASSMENTGTIIHFVLNKYREEEEAVEDEQKNIND